MSCSRDCREQLSIPSCVQNKDKWEICSWDFLLDLPSNRQIILSYSNVVNSLYYFKLLTNT